MANRLEVEIGAKIKEFQNKVAQALKLTDKLKAKEKELTKSYKAGEISADKYYNSLASNASRLATVSRASNTYKKSLDNVRGGMQQTTKSVKGGDSAMLAFSRTVQDAPFGMMGISNNITNLTEQFGYLKKRTGSAGSALKAMLGTLSGFGGITLAISLATSAWLVFGDKIMEAAKSNNALAKSQKAVNEALNGFYGGSVAKINSYIKILDNANTSETQRKEITEELIKLVPSLKKEDFKYGNNLDIVRGKIGQYVLAQASRIEADTLVQENSKKLAKQATANSLKAITDETKQIEAFRKFLNKEGVRTKRTSITSTYMSQGQSTERKATKEEIKKDFDKFVKELETELKPVQDRISELYSQTFSGGLGSGDGDTGGDKIRKSVTSSFDGLKDGYISSVKSFEDVVSTSPSPLDVVIKRFDIDALIMKARIQQFNQQLTELLSNSRFDLLSNLGTSIGNAMANGQNVLKAAGASLLGTMGSIMVKYGKLAIAYGLASEALKKSFQNPFGGGIGAIVGGIALVAVGSAISSFSSNVASGGAGGTQSTNAGASSTSGGSSFNGGSSGGFGSGTVVFEISGQKLVGVLSNTLERNRNLGGSLGII